MKKFLFICLCFLNCKKSYTNFVQTFENGHSIKDLDEKSLIGLNYSEVEKKIGKPLISKKNFFLFIYSSGNVNFFVPFIEKVKSSIILILKIDSDGKIVTSEKRFINSNVIKELENEIKKRIDLQTKNIKNLKIKLNDFNKEKSENWIKKIEKSKEKDIKKSKI